MKLRSSLSQQQLNAAQATATSAADYSIMSRIVHRLELAAQGKPADNPLESWLPRRRQNVIESVSIPLPFGRSLKALVADIEIAASARLKTAARLAGESSPTEPPVAAELLPAANYQCLVARDTFRSRVIGEARALDSEANNSEALLPATWHSKVDRILMAHREAISRGDHAPELTTALYTLDAAVSLGYSPEVLSAEPAGLDLPGLELPGL